MIRDSIGFRRGSWLSATKNRRARHADHSDRHRLHLKDLLSRSPHFSDIQTGHKSQTGNHDPSIRDYTTVRSASCPTETHRPRLYSRDDDLSHNCRHTSPPLEDNPRHRARKKFPDFETSAEVPARGMYLRSWEHMKHDQLLLTGPTVYRDPLVEKLTHQHTARQLLLREETSSHEHGPTSTTSADASNYWNTKRVATYSTPTAVQPHPFVFMGTDTVALSPEDQVTTILAFTSSNPEGHRRMKKETGHTQNTNNSGYATKYKVQRHPET